MSRPLRTSERRLALLVGDGVAVAAAVLLALWTWSITAGFPFDPAFLRARAVWMLAVPFWLVALMPTRHAAVAFDIRQTAHGITRAAAALLVVYLGAFFYAGGDKLPRLVALYVFWDATLLVFGWRIVALWSLTRAPFSRRVLIVGSGQALSTALDVLRHTSFRDADVVGVATDQPASADWHVPVLGLPGEVDQIARRLDVTDLIVALEGHLDDVDDQRDQWLQRLLRCQESGTRVVRLAQLYEDTLGRVPVEHVERSWLLTNLFDVAPFRDASPLAKRLLDVVVAALLSLVGLLLAPVIALAILIEGGRPIFYQQERLGRGGRLFHMTKFRTMKADAESDGQARWSSPNDTRVTRVGRWLRRTRLDELPNLLAVLRGEMSMVGPRPERPQFVEQLEREVPLYRARLIVAPGLTGWAQVNWTYGSSVRDATIKLEYDLYYIKHQSVWFDTLILLRTVGTMLRLGGSSAVTAGVVIPCRNEARRVAGVLDAVAAQDRQPDEVVVVDDGSSDGTAGVVEDWRRTHGDQRVRILPGPARGVAAAVNAGVAALTTDIVLRLDGHCRPAADYIARALALMSGPGVGVVGGTWLIEPGAASLQAEAIAIAVAHPLGSGGARYRRPASSGQATIEVDTVPFGCFTRALWEAMGGFDEQLLSNEDYDFNYRVRQRGLQVVLDPRMRCTYYARPTLRALARQYGRYGWWKARMLVRHPHSVRWRQLIPALLAPALLLGALGLLLDVGSRGSYLLAIYPAAVAIGAVHAAATRDRWAAVGWLVGVFITMHVMWSVAFWASLASAGRSRREARA